MSIAATILTVIAFLLLCCLGIALFSSPSPDLSDMPYPDDDEYLKD